VPNASVINYSNVPGLNIANGIAQPVCNDGTTTCNADLTVQADVAASHLVVDVVGYYRRFDKAVVKSFVITDTGVFGNTATTCTNAGGLSTTVTAPVSGTVVLDVSASHSFSHTAGTADTTNFYFGTTATSCTDPAGFLSLSDTVPSGFYGDKISARRTYGVAAGSTTTFFFNVLGQGDVGNDFISAFGPIMTATFIPD